MPSISVKSGDRLTVGSSAVIQVGPACGARVQLKIEAPEEVSVLRSPAGAPDGEELQEQLRELAREIASGLSGLEEAHSKELLATFVSELFLSAAEENRRAERRRKQAEGIAAAKARGVRFGRPAPPLPENFEECRRAWREGRMTVREAADACGMSRSSFYYAALRREKSEEEAV